MERTYRKLFYILLAAQVLICLQAQAGVANAQRRSNESTAIPNELVGRIENRWLTYTYEAVPGPVSKADGKAIYRGKITIQDKLFDNQVFYREMIDLDPRPGQCGDFPMLSQIHYKTN